MPFMASVGVHMWHLKQHHAAVIAHKRVMEEDVEGISRITRP